MKGHDVCVLPTGMLSINFTVFSCGFKKVSPTAQNHKSAPDLQNLEKYLAGLLQMI